MRIHADTPPDPARRAAATNCRFSSVETRNTTVSFRSSLFGFLRRPVTVRIVYQQKAYVNAVAFRRALRLKFPMKKIVLPPSVVIGDKEHSAVDILEDIVLIRQAWRIGEGPRHAEIVFAAFDKLRESVSSGAMTLPDKTYGFLFEQMILDPTTQISPRAANRFYLRIARAVGEADEVEEKP